MKHTKTNTILVLVLLCINSIGASGLMMNDSKVLHHGCNLLNESIAQNDLNDYILKIEECI
jgi:hypothetical protein